MLILEKWRHLGKLCVISYVNMLMLPWGFFAFFMY